MSHMVSIQTEFRDPAAIAAACRRLGIPEPTGTGPHQLYSGSHQGIGVQLKGWQYPVVINPKTGSALYDNYNGAWGDIARLNEFKQAYAVEAALSLARQQGFTDIAEEVCEDGSIRLTINQQEW